MLPPLQGGLAFIPVTQGLRPGLRFFMPSHSVVQSKRPSSSCRSSHFGAQKLIPPKTQKAGDLLVPGFVVFLPQFYFFSIALIASAAAASATSTGA
jgi:hypothetical protein